MNTPCSCTRATLFGALITLVLTTAGCGEVMFKRGAGPGDMQNAQSDCRRQAKDEDSYASCMREAGFVYDKPSAGGVLFVAPSPATAEGGAQNVVDGAHGEVTAAATTAPTPAPGAVTASVEPAGRAGERVAPPKPAPSLPANPLAQVTVASWWKLGGTAGGLEADQASCAAQLGVDHATSANARQVTVGLVSCLRGKGWFAVGQ